MWKKYIKVSYLSPFVDHVPRKNHGCSTSFCMFSRGESSSWRQWSAPRSQVRLRRRGTAASARMASSAAASSPWTWWPRQTNNWKHQPLVLWFSCEFLSLVKQNSLILWIRGASMMSIHFEPQLASFSHFYYVCCVHSMLGWLYPHTYPSIRTSHRCVMVCPNMLNDLFW